MWRPASPTRVAAMSLCAWLALSAAVLPLAAQTDQDAREPGSLQLTSGSIELARLVDLASQRLGVRVTYDEQLLKAKVTLRLPNGIDDRGLWELTNRVLAEQGLVTARLGGADDPALAIVKLLTAVQLAQPEPITREQLPEERQDGAGNVDSLFPQYLPSFRKLSVRVMHVPVRDVAAAVGGVGGLLSKPGGVAMEEPATGTVIIADFRGHAERAARAVMAMDVPSVEVRIVEHRCVHLAAAELSAIAMQVMGKRDGFCLLYTSDAADE